MTSFFGGLRVQVAETAELPSGCRIGPAEVHRSGKGLFMRKSNRFPTRFPPGSKYVLERRGPMVIRYIELPDGRRLKLPARKALTCCAAEASLVPRLDAEKKVRSKPSQTRILAEF